MKKATTQLSAVDRNPSPNRACTPCAPIASPKKNPQIGRMIQNSR